MNLKEVRLQLTVHEVQQLLAIDLDSDGQKALVFIKKTLIKRIEKALQPH